MHINPDFIGFGAVTVDDFIHLTHFPEQESKVKIEAKYRYGGGLAGNALVAAARLGTNPAYFGVLGDDELSEFVIDAFHKHGVQTHLCLYEQHAEPTHATILVDKTSGSRTVLYQNRYFQLPPISSITSDKFADCSMIFIDSASLPIIDHVLALAHSLEIPVLADIENKSITQHQKSLDAIDHLILNIKTAQEITGEQNPNSILRALETSKRKVGVITAGAEGCWFKVTGNPIFHMPAFPIKAVDTTGCGDVFHGAYAAALLRGSKIFQAVIQASAAAGMKATRPGGRAGIPTLSQLEQFIKSHEEIQPELID